MHHVRIWLRRTAQAASASLLYAVALATQAGVASAQTDYYNLDRGRPLRVEDAVAIERHALEWQLSPVRLSGARGAGSTLELEPELAWGLWPRTQVAIGLPLSRTRHGTRETIGGAGVDVSLLHALNTETISLPAVAIAARLLLPAGPLGPSRALPTFSALATRTTSWGRVHLNGSVTAGGAEREERMDGASRWEVGLAADHAFVFQSLLVGAELVARRPLTAASVSDAGDFAADVMWSAATGVRYQVGPRVAMDAGIGRDLSAGGEWFITFGSAVSLSLLHRVGGVR